MKKAMLCAVALLFGAVGFAQVTDADGNSSPSATPVGALSGAPASSANTGLSIQDGNNHKVRVRQAGTLQSVRTEQNDGSGLGGNQARVMQTGEVQAGSGVANLTEVIQSGTANQSTTIQEGDYNEAVTRQGQNNDASEGNRARIRQGNGQQAENNYAAIDQDGLNNQARTLQTYDNSDAWTIQNGEGNMSEINQNAGPDGTDGHYAMNQQEGDRNSSLINQQGAGARNSARTWQVGNDNKSQQTQTATEVAGGSGNDAGINQGGNYTNTSIAPEANTQWDFISNNINPPHATIGWNPPTEGNKAKQTQLGASNSAGIIQLGGNLNGSNYAEQDQEGDGNKAGMFQGHHFTDEASNYAKQEQLGTDNTAGLAQTGSANKSYQNQIGSDNISMAYQSGSGHMLNTHQFGNENVAYANQNGSCDAALIVQYDGQSYSVEQNVGLDIFDRSEGGNQADILQMGPDGDFGAGAVDCYFDEPMELDMPTPVDSFDLGDICPDCD